MTDTTDLDSEELREWLDFADEKETIKSLMLAIAYDNGADTSELASWYGESESQVKDVIENLRSRPAILSIAEWEGLNFERLADNWGLRPETIIEWFTALQSRPIQERAEIVHRYTQEGSVPLLAHPEATVDFLDYDVIEEREWTIDDDDLFEKARTPTSHRPPTVGSSSNPRRRFSKPPKTGDTPGPMPVGVVPVQTAQ